MQTSFLQEARAVRSMLKQSARYSHASIRDAIELAIDHRRQMQDEYEAESNVADRDYVDAYGYDY